MTLLSSFWVGLGAAFIFSLSNTLYKVSHLRGETVPHFMFWFGLGPTLAYLLLAFYFNSFSEFTLLLGCIIGFLKGATNTLIAKINRISSPTLVSVPLTLGIPAALVISAFFFGVDISTLEIVSSLLVALIMALFVFIEIKKKDSNITSNTWFILVALIFLLISLSDASLLYIGDRITSFTDIFAVLTLMYLGSLLSGLINLYKTHSLDLCRKVSIGFYTGLLGGAGLFVMAFGVTYYSPGAVMIGVSLNLILTSIAAKLFIKEALLKSQYALLVILTLAIIWPSLAVF